MRTLSVKLPEALHNVLEKAARTQGRTKSTVIRAALQAYLDGGPRRQRGSALDLAGKLVGCLKGPGDLSFGRKHMRGYGR